MQTGPNEGTFIGVVTGRFDVDTDQRPVDAGDLTCPMVLIVNLDANTQKGTGRCVLATQGDDRIFMNMTCEGVPLVGCAGELVVTGGTGQFANATGGGHFVVRSSTHELTKSNLTLSDFATGITFWPLSWNTRPRETASGPDIEGDLRVPVSLHGVDDHAFGISLGGGRFLWSTSANDEIGRRAAEASEWLGC